MIRWLNQLHIEAEGREYAVFLSDYRRWSGFVNHSRSRRIVSRLVLHSADGDVHVLSSFCCPRAELYNRAVVMITAGRT